MTIFHSLLTGLVTKRTFAIYEQGCVSSWLTVFLRPLALEFPEAPGLSVGFSFPIEQCVAWDPLPVSPLVGRHLVNFCQVLVSTYA